MLITHGEPHKRARKLMMPPFHGERMRTYTEDMGALARALVDEQQVGDTFDVMAMCGEMAMRTIIKVVFGVDDEATSRTVQNAIADMMDKTSLFFLFSKRTHVAPFGLGPFATFTKAVGQVHHREFDLGASKRGHL